MISQLWAFCQLIGTFINENKPRKTLPFGEQCIEIIVWDQINLAFKSPVCQYIFQYSWPHISEYNINWSFFNRSTLTAKRVSLFVQRFLNEKPSNLEFIDYNDYAT